MDTLIGINNITVGYGNTPVLEDVSFDIEDLDFLLLIGPNGGGKTTLLKVILGMIEPWRGRITFSGDYAGKIGYVPQFLHFNRNFPIDVYSMVLLGRLNRRNFYRKYTGDDHEKVSRILAKMDLQGLSRERVQNLSSGQLQRVLIARALVSEPRILLLDEPTASIDVTSKTTLIDIIDDLKNRMSIVMVTHDPTTFSLHYKHIACLNRQLYHHGREELDGRIIEQVYGCPVDLLGHGIPHTVLKRH